MNMMTNFMKKNTIEFWVKGGWAWYIWKYSYIQHYRMNKRAYKLNHIYRKQYMQE
jgi:hypothetical protein